MRLRRRRRQRLSIFTDVIRLVKSQVIGLCYIAFWGSHAAARYTFIPEAARLSGSTIAFARHPSQRLELVPHHAEMMRVTQSQRLENSDAEQIFYTSREASSLLLPTTLEDCRGDSAWKRARKYPRDPTPHQHEFR